MATAFDTKNPALFEVPVPPQEFGQDGGKFYHYYDALADEIDDNMVAGLKEQLDGLLIFAGLFAGVNTAFLALTLPLMSPDPADDTNALLRDILFNLASGRNDSLPSLSSVPSETFLPTGKILTVNVLFSLSLTFALVSSFLAVLGRQWLVYYRKRTGGGPERQRWEQLKRFLGAERWRLEGVLDDVLPSILQIGLIIFCISLTIYLSTLHPMLSNMVGGFMCAGLAILVITAIFAIWDKFCPFQSPLSHFISLTGRTAGLLSVHLLRIILWPFVWIALAVSDRFDKEPRYLKLLFEKVTVKKWLDKYLITSITSLPDYVKRKDESDGTLQITAIRRAICTSDDALTQAHAVSNILAITDANLLGLLAADEEFDDRISELCTTHVSLSAITLNQQLANKQLERLVCGTLDIPSLPLFPELLQNVNPNMTIACLGFVALFSRTDQRRTRVRRLELRPTIDGLVDPSWKCISMIVNVIVMHWGDSIYLDKEAFRLLNGIIVLLLGSANKRALGDVHKSYIGEPSAVHRNLKSLLEKSNDPQCQDRDILREYLVDVFKVAGKAAAGSRGDSSRSPAIAASFLRFSEGLVRGKDSPSNLVNAGRNLRPELISALHWEREKLSEEDGGFFSSISKETLDELIQLFTELTRLVPDHVYDERPTRTLNWDDKELVDLFRPIYQQLNAINIKNAKDWEGLPNTSQDYLELTRQVEELKSIFAKFEAVVKNSAARARKIKRRSRDPDLRWCYYYE